jgi:ParB family chromosome partitioning protein
MSKKRGLGRGLGALIPTDESGARETDGVRNLPIGDIRVNPHQPRTNMEEEGLAELAASIREHGLIQPLIVTSGAGEQPNLPA